MPIRIQNVIGDIEVIGDGGFGALYESWMVTEIVDSGVTCKQVLIVLIHVSEFCTNSEEHEIEAGGYVDIDLRAQP